MRAGLLTVALILPLLAGAAAARQPASSGVAPSAPEDDASFLDPRIVCRIHCSLLCALCEVQGTHCDACAACTCD